MPVDIMDNLGLLSSLPFQNVLLPCSPLMYSALMMASLYGCRCFMCKKNGLKRTMTNCESQSSDFAALSKCRRLDIHHDNNSGAICPLSDANSGRKCAGTQTLFSSFVPVPNFYPQPPPPPPPPTSDPCLHDNTTNEDEPRFILDLDRHMARSSHPGGPLHAGMRRGSTPPPLESESSNAPLNLTLSSSSKSGLRSPVSRDVQCGQWSVSRGDPHYEITWSASDERDYVRPSAKAAPDFCKTMPCKTMPSNNNNNNNRQPTQHKIWALTNDTRPSPAKTKQGTSPRKVTSVVTVECDRDIEEHFQRSLGKDYPKCLAAKNKQNTTTTPEAPTAVAPAPLVAPASMVASPALRNGTTPHTPPANVPETSQVNVTVSGSVDDHFAKSLGQTWTRLKSQTSQTSPEAKSPEPGSVDDHFAKALGETWFKLRVKKEGT